MEMIAEPLVLVSAAVQSNPVSFFRVSPGKGSLTADSQQMLLT